MKTSLRQFCITALVAVALAPSANAVAVNLTPSTAAVATGTENSNAAINAIIAGLIGNSNELYKQNYGDLPVDVGPFAGSYTTTFTTVNTGVVTYDGGPIINPTAYFLLKDGNSTPNWYLFNLTALNWTGTENISFTGFFLGSGPGGADQSISHITMYGTGFVPDGGSTVAMMGGALVLLAGLTRRGISFGAV